MNIICLLFGHHKVKNTDQVAGIDVSLSYCTECHKVFGRPKMQNPIPIPPHGVRQRINNTEFKFTPFVSASEIDKMFRGFESTDTEFTYNNYGTDVTLKVGQKVQCVYYNEHEDGQGYMRPKKEIMNDLPFKPVKCGTIIGNAGIHPYWLAPEKKQQYLFVEFKEYKFKKAIPISCIKDAKEEAKRTMNMLERNKDRIGQPGFSQQSYDTLLSYATNALNF